MSNSILRKKTWTLSKDKFRFIVFLSSFFYHLWTMNGFEFLLIRLNIKGKPVALDGVVNNCKLNFYKLD
ncbi:hypothetical protein TFKS16_2748 [Tannerella forsythia KS16]|nr:hypothetical protein TFKS16_2748 [Tannerella forsythia KS16]